LPAAARRNELADDKKRLQDKLQASDQDVTKPSGKAALDDMLQKKGLAGNVQTGKGPERYLDTYVVQQGDTLSGIAARYYGSAVREKWMAIYEANKAVIGDNPSLIKPGQELKIPKLDE
jgi:nucleoid-associated protein YgaU